VDAAYEDETDEIADFMAARLDELEARAEANASSIPGEWKRVICDPVIGAFGGQTRDRNISRGMYLADMSDPAVVGASVAADRAMLHEHAAFAGIAVNDPSVREWANALGRMVRIRASAWAAHPGYKAEWKP
jgi:hypothetical protein